ncbi:DUF732 domain-containing protein [Mycobacterium sp. MMS18-G62]
MKRLIISAAAIATAMGLAAPANADQYDFISALDDAGVVYVNGSISDMMDLGKAACHDLRIGTAPGTVVVKLGQLGYADYETGTIMGAAANGMCPDTWPVLSAYANGVLNPAPVVDEY